MSILAWAVICAFHMLRPCLGQVRQTSNQENRKMTDLTKMTDEELLALQRDAQAERNKRAEERRLSVEQGVFDRLDAYLEVIGHGRTSCSDEDPSNAYPNDHGVPRCVRCALLYAKRNGSFLYPLASFSITAHITYKYEGHGNRGH